MNTSVTVAGVTFRNPIITASGTFGSGREYEDFGLLDRIGAVTTKGVSATAWEGNPTPRVTETYGGMLNAIGLQNPGVDVFIDRDLPFLAKYRSQGLRVIVNVCGHTLKEYVEVVTKLADCPDVDMLEINVSCPNVESVGLAFGTDPKCLMEVTREVAGHASQPVIMKLSPNVTSIADMARAAEAGGADAISLINTLIGMKINVNTRRFALAHKTGGLSGPAIHPVAVRMVYEAACAVSIPVIGMGGVMTGDDAVEMMLAGASLVAVGMAHFANPTASLTVLNGLCDYLHRTDTQDVNTIIGAVT